MPIGFCVFVFLITFKPFSLSNDPDYLKSAAFFSFSGTIIGLLTTVLIPIASPKYFNESRWTIKRNFIWGSLDFFCFATLMFVAFNIHSISRYNNYGNFTFNKYLWWVYINLIFGLPLGIIINLFNQHYLLKKHLKIAAKIIKTIEIKNQHSESLMLEFDVNKYKKVGVKVKNLIYVEVLGNYVNIVYECDGIKKITVRETISNIEQKLKHHKIIFKPHRSYLINLQYITNITGDAQGLKIYFKNIDTAVPVSRNKIREFRLLTSLKNN